jgi:hypothetical protein
MQNKSIVLLLIFFIAFITKGTAQDHAKKEAGFIKIFNGKNLQGWEGDSLYWRVENEILVGEVTAATILKRNSFIVWKNEQPADFELKVDYRVSAHGNSGINYRSVLVNSTPFALKGYQADIDGENNWSGQNYEERGREFLALRGQKVIIENDQKPFVIGNLGSKDSLQAFIHKEDWNTYHLIVKSHRMLHYINGVLMSDVTDNDKANRTNKGYIGVQVHVGPPMKIEYRNFMLKKL